MTVKDFLDASLEVQLIAIFDYNAQYDVINNDYSDYGAFIFEGWMDELERTYNGYETDIILESGVESWDYINSEKFDTTMICLNIAIEN